MNLVLFDQAMEHICRICRIIDTPGGNALLIGVGDSGKQLLSRLAAFIIGCEVEQVVVTSSYNMNDLKTFLQELFKKCVKSSGGGPRAFMLTDSQITRETFLVYINDMLSQSYIPDLFPKEGEEGLIQGLRNEAKGLGISEGEALRQYFLDKLKRNLHVILCFSPVGDTMRIRARKFPGIINATQIVWVFGWPEDAFIDVARRFISDIELSTPELYDALAQKMAAVHVSIDKVNKKFLAKERRYNYTTPKRELP
jgi:dynein heavy chain